MAKKKFIIDGRFLTSISTGVDRYAYEIVKAIDEIIYKENQNGENEISIYILVPPNVKDIPQYKSIHVKRPGFSKCWTQGVFALTCRAMRGIPINLCNEVSVLAPKGICALHDVCYAEDNIAGLFPDEERQWFLNIYKRIKKRVKVIITVSEFSKNRISEKLKIDRDKIVVAGNGWQHFQKLQSDDDVLKRFPEIKKGEYFFTISSANPNKNIKWIVENAKRHPEQQFVIGGKNLDKAVNFKELDNVLYVGFLKDSYVKCLMANCKAFIFPSIYEGFGIPPMEALSTGAAIVISNTSSLPEIFEKSAVYIEPDKYDVNLDTMLLKQVKPAEYVLNKYSWTKSAMNIYNMLKSY